MPHRADGARRLDSMLLRAMLPDGGTAPSTRIASALSEPTS